MTRKIKPILRPYQRRWMRRWMAERKSLVVGPRQVGKSFCVGLFALWEAPQVRAISPTAGVLIGSKDQRLASIMLSGIAAIAEAAERAGVFTIDSSTGRKTEFRLADPPGTIYALPSGPGIWQGVTGTRIWDEVGANRHDPSETWAQLDAAGTADPRYRTILISNATSQGSWLDRLLHEESEYFEAFRRVLKPEITTIWDAYPEGLPPHLEETRSTMTRAQWRRWYECEFTRGGLGVLEELLPLAEDLDVGSPVGRPVMGVDVGVTQDASGFVILQDHERGRKVIYSEARWRMPIEEQIDYIQALAKQHNVGAVYVDQGAQGYAVAQALVSRMGVMAQGVSVNEATRHRGLVAIESQMGAGKFSIPSEWSQLAEHLSDVGRDERDRVTLPRVSDKQGRRHHCDLADAAMIAAAHMGSLQQAQTSAFGGLRPRSRRSSSVLL